jgi:hypothetical protein
VTSRHFRTVSLLCLEAAKKMPSCPGFLDACSSWLSKIARHISALKSSSGWFAVLYSTS